MKSNIHQASDTPETSEEIPPEFLALSQARGRPTLYTVVNDSIDESLLFAVADELADRTFEELDWLIVTWGGSAETGLMTARLVRELVGDLTVLLPAQAHSAGTAMALAADTILFSRTGSLSALDCQISHRGDDGGMRLGSSLAMRDALQEIKELSVDLFQMALREVERMSDLDQAQALGAASSLVGAVLGPMTSGLDVERLGDRRRLRHVGRAFADEILAGAGYLDERERARALDELCFNLPTHGYPIRHDHAAAIGLNAELASGATAAALSGLSFLASHEGTFCHLVEQVPSAKREKAA